MADPDPRFPKTRWSIVRNISSPEDATRRAALETLCKSYWYPLYACARRSGLQQSDAEDSVQETFARLLTNNRFAMADPKERKNGEGRMRNFLLAVLSNVISKERRKNKALKRGGGAEMLSLDMQDAEGRYLEETEAKAFPTAPSLDKYFDHQWAVAVIKAARQVLRSEYHADGKGNLFDALEPALESEERWSLHAETAAKLGMTVEAVKVALHRLRKRYGKALLEEVRHTLLDEKEAEDEFKLLIAAVSR